MTSDCQTTGVNTDAELPSASPAEATQRGACIENPHHCVSRESYLDGMRRLTGAVCVITTRRSDGRWQGLTATAVCSVSADPPTLLVCVNRRTFTHACMTLAGHFCVNVLAANHSSLSQAFGSSTSAETRFDEASWTELVTGAPALVGSLASFDCQVERAIDAGSHTIYIARVVDVVAGPPATPLLYGNGRYLCPDFPERQPSVPPLPGVKQSAQSYDRPPHQLDSNNATSASG